MQAQDARDTRVKRVTFSDKIIIHPIIHWNFAYRKARGGALSWVADRHRFNKRIRDLQKKINGFSI